MKETIIFPSQPIIKIETIIIEASSTNISILLIATTYSRPLIF
jgi:hypothetical protein